jgi:hypothetical protein
MASENKKERIQKEITEALKISQFLSIVNATADIIYTVIIGFFAAQPLVAVLLCLSMPALNVGAFLTLTKRGMRPYYVTILLSGGIMFGINYFTGPQGPGWFFGLSVICNSLYFI